MFGDNFYPLTLSVKDNMLVATIKSEVEDIALLNIGDPSEVYTKPVPLDDGVYLDWNPLVDAWMFTSKA